MLSFELDGVAHTSRMDVEDSEISYLGNEGDFHNDISEFSSGLSMSGFIPPSIGLVKPTVNIQQRHLSFRYDNATQSLDGVRLFLIRGSANVSWSFALENPWPIQNLDYMD